MIPFGGPAAALASRVAPYIASAARKGKKVKKKVVEAAEAGSEKAMDAAKKVEASAKEVTSAVKEKVKDSASKVKDAAVAHKGAVGATLAAGAAGGVASAVAAKATKEVLPEDEPETMDEGPTHERSDTGAHIITTSSPDSVAYKVASKFGNPIEENGKYRFSLTESEYARYQRETGA